MNKFIIVQLTKNRYAVAERNLTLKSAKLNEIQQYRVFTKPLKHEAACNALTDVATNEPVNYSQQTKDALLYE